MVFPAIPYNEGTHLKYFTKGRDVYEEYYGYFIRCSDIFDLRHKPIMHAKMIDWLRPWRFISNPEVTKKEWDAISDPHPKTMMLCAPIGLDAEGNEAYAELCADIYISGSEDDPLYLRIQKFHRNKIT